MNQEATPRNYSLLNFEFIQNGNMVSVPDYEVAMKQLIDQLSELVSSLSPAGNFGVNRITIEAASRMGDFAESVRVNPFASAEERREAYIGVSMAIGAANGLQSTN